MLMEYIQHIYLLPRKEASVLPFQKTHDPFTKEHKMTTFTLKLLLYYTKVLLKVWKNN